MLRDDVQDYTFSIDPTVESIPVSTWVQIVERFARNRPVRFDVLEKGKFRHPWNVALRWNAQAERWESNVEPGFVNGLDSTIRLDQADAPEKSLVRIEEETGERPGRVDAWLTESPWFPLRLSNWRTIGTDALALELEKVPEFFAQLGVREGSTLSTTPTGVKVSTPDQLPGPRRLLRAQDLILTQDRPALVPVIGDDGGLATLDFTLSPAGRERSFLSFVQNWEPAPVVTGQEIIAGATDRPFEQLHLATVYLLSKDGQGDGSEPDETWTPFVSHKVFWNLNYSTNIDLRETPRFQRFPLLVPLAGGIAQPLIDEITDGLTDAANQALTLLNQSKVAGKFWII